VKTKEREEKQGRYKKKERDERETETRKEVKRVSMKNQRKG
jgi:hypothetical protein